MTFTRKTFKSMVRHGLKKHFDYDNVIIHKNDKIVATIGAYRVEYHLGDFYLLERKSPYRGVKLIHRGNCIFTFADL